MISLVEIYRRFGRTSCLQHQDVLSAKENSMLLRNVGEFVDFMTSHSKEL